MAKHNPFLPNIPKPGVVDLPLFFLELCPLLWSRTSCKPAKQAISSVLKYLLVSALSPLPSWGREKHLLSCCSFPLPSCLSYILFLSYHPHRPLPSLFFC